MKQYMMAAAAFSALTMFSVFSILPMARSYAEAPKKIAKTKSIVPATAEPVVTRKPAQESTRPIVFKIVYGDRDSQIVLVKTKAGGQMFFSNNHGKHMKREISSQDYEYFRTRFTSLPGPTNKKQFCERSYAEITSGSDHKVGCLKAKNKLSREMREISDIMATLF